MIPLDRSGGPLQQSQCRLHVQAWDHLRRRFRCLWDRSCRPCLIDPVALAAASSSSRSPCFDSAALTPSLTPASSPPVLRQASTRCSFTEVASASGMSGPPQRPPHVGAFASGHVRPPMRQPAPTPAPALSAVATAGAGGSGVVASMLLQPPSRQFGPLAYLPPQQLPFVQYSPYQQFQHLSFPPFAQPSQ
jgi:hypothetical protein